MQILKSILYKKALDKQLAKKKEIEDAKLKMNGVHRLDLMYLMISV